MWHYFKIWTSSTIHCLVFYSKFIPFLSQFVTCCWHFGLHLLSNKCNHSLELETKSYLSDCIYFFPSLVAEQWVTEVWYKYPTVFIGEYNIYIYFDFLTRRLIQNNTPVYLFSISLLYIKISKKLYYFPFRIYRNNKNYTKLGTWSNTDTHLSTKPGTLFTHFSVI